MPDSNTNRIDSRILRAQRRRALGRAAAPFRAGSSGPVAREALAWPGGGDASWRSPSLAVLSWLLGLGLSLAACNSSTPSTGDLAGPGPDAASLGCSPAAQTTYSASSKTVTGSGSLACSVAADLSIRVCLWAKATTDTAWGDPLVCKTQSGSAMLQLSADVAVAVGIGGSKDYRSSVEPQINGASQPAVYSSVVVAP